MSLRSRLLAGLALVTVVLVGVAVLVTATTRAYLVQQVDDRLAQVGRGDRDSGFDRSPANNPADRRPPPSGPDRLSDLYEAVIEEDGTLRVYFEPNAPGDTFSLPDVSDVAESGQREARLITVNGTDDDVRYRMLVRSTDDGRTFLTAAPLNDVDAAIDRLVRLEAGAVAAVLVVLGAVAWWMIRLGIRPIKHMTATAEQIAASDLTARVPASHPGTEAGQLAEALNGMLSRIEHSVEARAASEERLRRFVADASHELRTPVTTIRGYADLYGMGGLSDPAELDDAMRRTREESERMGRLVDDMLTLAKLDEERPLQSAPVDLAVLVTDAALDARAVAPDRSVTYSTSQAVVTGDVDRLRQVVANVVGNALVHTPPTAAIRLAAGTEGGHAFIEVIDDGPGMAEEAVERITERFYRADPSRARSRGGSGLGMAIVDSVVAAHGGTIHIHSKPGSGTTVRLTIPQAL